MRKSIYIPPPCRGPVSETDDSAVESMQSGKELLTLSGLGRIQEKCQPRDDAGYDEDGFVGIARNLSLPMGHFRPDGRGNTGHVEKTSDRDYEIEERYFFFLRVRGLGGLLENGNFC